MNMFLDIRKSRKDMCKICHQADEVPVPEVPGAEVVQEAEVVREAALHAEEVVLLTAVILVVPIAAMLLTATEPERTSQLTCQHI